MKQPLSALRALALAAGVTFASTPMLAAAPLHVPQLVATSSDVAKVQSSTTIIRRDKPHDGAWKKRPHNRGELRRDGRREAHDRHDGKGRNNIYKPRSTPKYAYDAQGNFRVYDNNRPRRDGRWDDRRDDWRWSKDWRRWEDRDWWDESHWDDGHWNDRAHWDDRHRRRHEYKMNSFGFQQPSPALKKVLTAVPKDADPQ
jgi:hypothetical protein